MAERNANTLRRRQGESNLLFAALPDQLKKDGALQGQQRLPATGSGQATLGLGDPGTGARNQRFRLCDDALPASLRSGHVGWTYCV